MRHLRGSEVGRAGTENFTCWWARWIFAQSCKFTFELGDDRTPGRARPRRILLTILPNAAELYRRQIALGLGGAYPQIVLKGRLALRELLGQIRVEPGEDGSLWAAYEVRAIRKRPSRRR